MRGERNLALTEMERVCMEHDDTLQQIEPLLKQVEELKLERETSEALGQERQAMMWELIQHAQRVYSRLYGENLGLPGAFQPGVATSHVFFFLSLVEHSLVGNRL